MSVNEKMTALANEVRRVSHKEGKLSIDGMTSALSGINENLFKSIMERRVTKITAEDLAGVEWIGARAFASCAKLETVTLTDAIRSIGQAAFQYCTSLTDIVIGNNVVDVETQAFQYCDALEEVVLSDSVGWVGAMAFADCPNLKRVIWSAKAPGLYGYCFGSCSSMEYVDFSKCTKVAPLAAGVNSINETPETCKFYVPAELLDEWKAADHWKEYADRIVESMIYLGAFDEEGNAIYMELSASYKSWAEFANDMGYRIDENGYILFEIDDFSIHILDAGHLTNADNTDWTNARYVHKTDMVKMGSYYTLGELPG